ncbi:MAG: NAD-dependent epimerase/dehydratase family protein [Planctomycetota bacterium]|jgi:nucleoside-diphosphate-sugar epimerase|nr:NAD-dependent epimerase/dehydratase family protein [Planctomycetota bacterium]
MKIMILGGTGVISRAIARLALERGFEVSVVNRGQRKVDLDPRIRRLQADRTDPVRFRETLKGEKPDVVIDMICFNPDDARQTLEIFRQLAGHIIFTSSTAAYDRPYKSVPAREDLEKPLLTGDFAYGLDKAAMERFLFGEMGKPGAALTIIRPSLTFGAGSRNFGMLRQNYNVVQRIREKKPLVMVGEGMAPWTFTYVDDLANGYLLACGNANTFDNHFQVLNDEVMVWEDLYHLVGDLVGEKPILNYVPSSLLRELDDKLTGHLHHEKVHCSVFSIEKFQKAAPEFRPVHKFRDGLAKVIESWEQDGLGVDPVKDRLEDDICACYAAFRDGLLKLKSDRK